MKKKIFAICGSTRKNSTNLQLLKAIAALSSHELEIGIYDQTGFTSSFSDGKITDEFTRNKKSPR